VKLFKLQNQKRKKSTKQKISNSEEDSETSSIGGKGSSHLEDSTANRTSYSCTLVIIETTVFHTSPNYSSN